MAMGVSERAEKVGLPLELALHRAARAVGIKLIADTYGHGYTSLANNLNPDMPERHPTMQQFEDICMASTARGKEGVIADSLGDLLGGVFIRLPENACEESMDVFASIGELTNNLARLAKHVGESLEDGYVDPDELAMLKRDVNKLYQAGNAVVAAAEKVGGRK